MHVLVVDNSLRDNSGQIIKERYRDYENIHVIHAATGGHQSPIDLRLRTEEEAEATIKKNRIALKFFGVLAPVLSMILDGTYARRHEICCILK